LAFFFQKKSVCGVGENMSFCLLPVFVASLQNHGLAAKLDVNVTVLLCIVLCSFFFPSAAL
jgi:hypothetical protein